MISTRADFEKEQRQAGLPPDAGDSKPSQQTQRAELSLHAEHSKLSQQAQGAESREKLLLGMPGKLRRGSHYNVMGQLQSMAQHSQKDGLFLVKKKPLFSDNPDKAKYEKVWLRKSMFDREDDGKSIPNLIGALRETLAAEINRLLNPTYQRRVRYYPTQSISDCHYVVMSEFIPNFQHLPMVGLFKGFLERRYRGLGDLLVNALFLREVDLKRDNFGVDFNGNIVKIDGGCSLGESYGKDGKDFRPDYEIVPADLDKLPLVEKYDFCNFMDYIHFWDGQELTSEVVALTRNLQRDEAFRAEVHRALLKIALLPSDFFAMFIRRYTSYKKYIDYFGAMIKQQQTEIAEALPYVRGFKAYMGSTDAKFETANLKRQIAEFKPIGKQRLFAASELTAFFSAVDKNFGTIKNAVDHPVVLPGSFEGAERSSESKSEQKASGAAAQVAVPAAPAQAAAQVVGSVAEAGVFAGSAQSAAAPAPAAVPPVSVALPAPTSEESRPQGSCCTLM